MLGPARPFTSRPIPWVHGMTVGCDFMKSSSRVLAIILNWNGYELTSRCVEHLRRQTHTPLDLLVIDNGSTDGSVEQLTSDGLGSEEILALPENRGFSGGMNAGLEVALAKGYDYVWILNNDAFPEPDCLSKLVQVMEENPRDAIISPRLIEADGRDQEVGWRISWDSMAVEGLFADQVAGLMPENTWITGAALLVRCLSLREEGLYDDRFFAYWEDVDLCFRYRGAGWGLRVAGAARCVHLGGSSSGGSHSPFVCYMNTRNRWHFLIKHMPTSWHPWCRCKLASLALFDAAGLHSRGFPESGLAVIAAAFAMVRAEVGRPATLSPSPRVGRFLLKHWWRISQGLEQIARRLPSPVGSDVHLMGQPAQSIKSAG